MDTRNHNCPDCGARFFLAKELADHAAAQGHASAIRHRRVLNTTRTDDNAAYRRDMIDAGRGHLLR